MTSGPTPAPERALSILACGGRLPLEVAQVLQAKGYRLNIVAISDIADADFDGFKTQTVSLGRLGAMLRGLRAGDGPDLLIAGHLHRPNLAGLSIDFGFVRHLGSILSLLRGGDDHILRRIARFFELNGFIVHGVADLAPELLTPPGCLTGEDDPALLKSAACGLAVIRDLAPFDIGQAVIVSGDTIVAIEGAEGTNGLIERCRHSGTEQAASPLVLVKGLKPGQDQRLDLPTIGPETVARCAAAGTAAIAVEAGHSLIVSRAETVARARQAGISVIGFVAEVAAERAGIATAVSAVSASLATRQPGRLDRANATKGVAVLRALDGHVGTQAVLVESEHVVALNVGEPMAEFLRRTRKLVRWGSRRPKRALIVAGVDRLRGVSDEDFRAAGIAGITLVARRDDPPPAAALDALIVVANRNQLFLMSTR